MNLIAPCTRNICSSGGWGCSWSELLFFLIFHAYLGIARVLHRLSCRWKTCHAYNLPCDNRSLTSSDHGSYVFLTNLHSWKKDNLTLLGCPELHDYRDRITCDKRQLIPFWKLARWILCGLCMARFVKDKSCSSFQFFYGTEQEVILICTDILAGSPLLFPYFHIISCLTL